MALNNDPIITLLTNRKNTYVLSINNKEIKKVHKQLVKSSIIELNILTKFNHPNILNLENFYFRGFKLYIMIKAGECTLSSYLENIDDRFILIRKILLGLQYLHNNNIVHLDLKSDNIVIYNGEPKIIDFDSAEYIFSPFIIVHDLKTTTIYRPPEQFRPDDGCYYVSKLTDVWCMAFIISEIMTEKITYNNKNLIDCSRLNDSTIIDIVENTEFINKIKKTLPDALIKCLELDPVDRLTMKELLDFFSIEHEEIITDIYYDDLCDITKTIIDKLKDHPNFNEYYPKKILKKYDDRIREINLSLEDSIEYFVVINNILGGYLFIEVEKYFPNVILDVITLKKIVNLSNGNLI